MSILDKLQALIKVDISSLKEIKISIGSNNNKFENKGNIFFINTNYLEKKESQIVKHFLESTVGEGNLLLEENSEKLLKEVKSIEKEGVNKSLLDFFNGKIPSTDLEILRAAFVIKELHEKHQPVGKLKLDIMQRYGKRGSNISNLCTAGYFNSIIKPLYQAMVLSSNFTQEQFLEKYNVIVDQYTFAVFVSSRMSEDVTKNNILRKIKLNKKYGIHEMNVHGIGIENVLKINKVLYKINKEIQWPAEVDSGNSFINVKLRF